MIDEPLALLAEAFGQDPEPDDVLAEAVMDGMPATVPDPIASILSVGPAHIDLAPSQTLRQAPAGQSLEAASAASRRESLSPRRRVPVTEAIEEPGQSPSSDGPAGARALSAEIKVNAGSDQAGCA